MVTNYLALVIFKEILGQVRVMLGTVIPGPAWVASQVPTPLSEYLVSTA